MSKVFEDYFAEIHTDMVDICMEYVDDVAEKIYIYGSVEDGMITADFFYKIDGNILKRHKINMVSSRYDVSVQRQNMCLDILIEDLEKLISLCKEYDRPMPTEIKMVYDVNKNSLNVDYKYDPVYSNHKTKLPDDIVEEWFEEVKNSNQ
ncbi:MAG: DUF600 family protein [Clostridia bacterium]|nr:DUF600 family protein [Clostridia bacterium]